MLQVTRGAQFPLITVRLQLPERGLDGIDLDCGMDVQFAGTTTHYTHVLMHQAIAGADRHIAGMIQSKLTDFGIEAPSFLTVPIKDEYPSTSISGGEQAAKPGSGPDS